MLGLVIWILVGFISAFLIPSEVGKMYRKAGLEPPVTGWTGSGLVPGVILIIPAIVWFVKIQGALNRYWTGATSRRASKARKPPETRPERQVPVFRRVRASASVK